MPFPRRRRSQRVSLYRRMPLWFQWAFPCVVAIAAVVFVIRFVDTHNSNGEAAYSAKGYISSENESSTLMKQEQAPHVVRMAAGKTAAAGLAQAVTHWINHEYSIGVMTGPVQSDTCTPLKGAAETSSRVALNCDVKSGSGKSSAVTFDFQGVVQPKLRVITFCQKIEYSAVYGQKRIPVSSACS